MTTLLLFLTLVGDTVLLANGKALQGVVVKEDDAEVVVNPWNSTNPGMEYGVERVPRSKVKSIKREERPLEEYLRRAAALKAADAAGHFELAQWCGERSLPFERNLELERTLEADPAHAAALQALGKEAFDRLAKGNPAFQPALRELLQQYPKVEDPAERKKLWERARSEHGYARPFHYLERVWRSTRAPRGYVEDRPITLESEKHPGVYTLFVPPQYDPVRPWPLLIGLHGGGVGGKEGDAVVGSGKQAMSFYRTHAERLGYLVACPTAIRAPWAAQPNESFIQDLVTEMELVYHVDRNRIYLTGHSMGGFGTWHHGPRNAERFAAISPMAGGGPGGYHRLKETLTPIFVFHGTDDPVCSVEPDRAAAKQLRDLGVDFVYTELPRVGHGFPPSVADELFRFFAVKRQAVSKGGKGSFAVTHGEDSSFLQKATPAEKKYFGDPEAGLVGEEAAQGVRALVRELKRGGGSAREAADQLIAKPDPEAVAPLGELVLLLTAPEDARVQAARALGGMKLPGAVPSLAGALKTESAPLYVALCEALATIGDAKAAPPIVRSLAALERQFEGALTGKTKMDYSDWERRLRTFEAAVRALGALGDPAAAPAIVKHVVKRVLLPTYDVDYSQRAGQNPSVPLGKLGAAVADALRRLTDPAGAAALRQLAERWKDDPTLGRTFAP
jgi:acetyl esterase/lipase